MLDGLDLRVAKIGADYVSKRKRWIILLAALGFTGYGAYKVYSSPAAAKKRDAVYKIFRSLISLADAASVSAETVGFVTNDVKGFLQSQADEIPKSLKQISKVATSDEFSESATQVTRALTRGFIRATRSTNNDLCVSDRVLDKLLSTAGTGFASVIVGSFAKNLAMAFSGEDGSLLPVLCSDKGREMVGECVQKFVSTAVAIYLDKTMHINAYDEFFEGMTSRKHEDRVRDLLVTVCNGAVETLVKTSHDVLTAPAVKFETKHGGTVERAFCALEIPRNRRLVLDVTGRVASETVRSMLEFMVEKVCDGLRSGVDAVGIVAVGAVSKSWAFLGFWISACVYVVDGALSLLPVPTRPYRVLHG